MKTSTQLQISQVYTRKQLMEMFAITDATINTGIFRPAGHDSVWLFVTENKTPDRTQYNDRLDGDDLYFDGQTAGRTDHLILDHETLDLELLVFYRREKYEHAGAGFRYMGPFRFQSSEGLHPRHFHLERITGDFPALSLITSVKELRQGLAIFNAEAPIHPDRAQKVIESMRL